MATSSVSTNNRKCRTICISISEDIYSEVIKDSQKFRKALEGQIVQHPELFPPNIEQGFQLKDTRHSVKLDLPIRRIESIWYESHSSTVICYSLGPRKKLIIQFEVAA